MCGRFTQHLSWAEIHRLAGLIGQPRNLPSRFNIAPTTAVEVIRPATEGGAELVPMRWGPPAVVVEEAVQGAAGDVQRPRRDCGREADVPLVLQGPPQRHPNERLLRLDRCSRLQDAHYVTATSGEPLAFAALWEQAKHT